MGNRGVLSSLGAGLSLVIAGVIVLVVASAIVAFNGWPGMDSDSTAEVRIARVAAPPRTAAEPVVVGGRESDTRRSSRRRSARRRAG
ncbi:MAG: hypothetical protein M3P50_06610, partial [Actinomycetota bacterium]|nr:hypothetical protein [Actinomycetota bacterium]